MASTVCSTPILLMIPDPCLLAVMQYLADDPVSLFSAARAHSRLHQAAVVALSSISMSVHTQQQLNDSLLPYLGKHGQHVGSVVLLQSTRIKPIYGGMMPIRLQQLPHSLQLTSLHLEGVSVQLQPVGGFQGVLRPGLPLKQLQLGCSSSRISSDPVRRMSCTLLDEQEGLAAALHGLPHLEHLTVSISDQDVAPRALQELQRLTYLNLHCKKSEWYIGRTFLQPLERLTRLVDLRVTCLHYFTLKMLSGLCGLTRLHLSEGFVHAAALAGKTHLQHLELESCDSPDRDAAGIAQLLSQLQHLTQLTHLNLSFSIQRVDDSIPPAAAYSALTASSKLQHLEISGCLLPVGAWQHVFPAGRQLPHMQELDIDGVKLAVRGYWHCPFEMEPRHGYVTAPGGSLVSCCRELQSLDLHKLECSKELLAALSRLSRLTLLRLSYADGESDMGDLEFMCQLKGLRHLVMVAHRGPQLLLLTELKQLTHLFIWGAKCDYTTRKGPPDGSFAEDEPVWRQLLKDLQDLK